MADEPSKPKSKETKPKPKPKETKPDDSFVSFLKKHGISNDKAIDTLKEFGVTSLEELLTTKQSSDIYESLKEKLKSNNQQITGNALEKIAVQAIENAIYYSNNAGTEAEAKKLTGFFIKTGMKSDENGKEKLLHILREYNVKSLNDLATIKEKGEQDKNLKALVDEINKLDREVGSVFSSITAVMVNKELRAPKANEELKEFIEKRKLPPGTEETLVASGITSLEQLKTVKEDETPNGKLARLKQKLGDQGIDVTQFNKIDVADIEHEIAVVNAPPSEPTEDKSAELKEAIKKVEKLRKEVETATDSQFTSVKTSVEAEHKAVLEKIGDVSGVDFTKAMRAAASTKADLIKLLDDTIENAKFAEDLMKGVDKVKRPLADIVKQHNILCGFLISPDETTPRNSELVRMPESLDEMVKAPGAQESKIITYKGSQTTSFAVSCYEQSSSTLATASKMTGAFFTGSGIGAVSVAATYADAKKASEEEKKFTSATTSYCGELRYLYVPKNSLQFDKNKHVHLSYQATKALENIAGLSGDETKKAAIKSFYEEFGSHFFLESSLGGRYKFEAKGESTSQTEKSLLVSAVTDTANWAVSASGSYATMGAAGQAASSVKGSKSHSVGRGDRYELQFDYAKVDVETSVLGGAGLATQDVWQGSLRYNSTWAVIDRKSPIAVWELIRNYDSSLTGNIKNLAPLMESTWVREIFVDAVRSSYPALYNYLKLKPNICTCKSLKDAVDEVSKEPDVEIVVVMQSSDWAEHPRATAGSTKKGLKLIGGGAMVDYGTGKGNMLTGSYPEGNSWVASAKSHAESCSGRVTAYAIYLNDPFNLWEVKMVTERTRTSGNRPEVTAILPGGYALTGGGAKVDWNGKGIILTACCPAEKTGSYVGWTAKGKDHYAGCEDSGHATAWVFGIRPTNGLEPMASSVTLKTKQGIPSTLESAGGSSEEVIVGGGSAVTYRGDGGLLTCSGPSDDSKIWKAKAKDHLSQDTTLDLSMWVISRKGKTLRNKMITELTELTKGIDGGYQSLTDDQLEDQRAVLIYFREVGHTDQELKTWTINYMRNGMITTVNNKSGGPVPGIQGMSNRDIIKRYLTES
ncbi:MAG: hypothetical protein CV088_04025 [Nitrospira sp. LK70]|nr:hypothetical protein [Nitrospira sp. LK70]